MEFLTGVWTGFLFFVMPVVAIFWGRSVLRKLHAMQGSLERMEAASLRQPTPAPATTAAVATTAPPAPSPIDVEPFVD